MNPRRKCGWHHSSCGDRCWDGSCIWLIKMNTIEYSWQGAKTSKDHIQATISQSTLQKEWWFQHEDIIAVTSRKWMTLGLHSRLPLSMTPWSLQLLQVTLHSGINDDVMCIDVLQKTYFFLLCAFSPTSHMMDILCVICNSKYERVMMLNVVMTIPEQELLHESHVQQLKRHRGEFCTIYCYSSCQNPLPDRTSAKAIHCFLLILQSNSPLQLHRIQSDETPFRTPGENFSFQHLVGNLRFLAWLPSIQDIWQHCELRHLLGWIKFSQLYIDAWSEVSSFWHESYFSSLRCFHTVRPFPATVSLKGPLKAQFYFDQITFQT